MNRSSLDLCRWHAVLDEQTLQKAAVEAILASAAQALEVSGRALNLLLW